MTNLLRQLDRSAAAVQSVWPRSPRLGVVLGSGLTSLTGSLDLEAEIPGSSIPGFASATAMGHRGQFLCGELQGVPAVMLDGRPHSYEGHAFDAVAFPVRLMMRLGIRILVLSNASGAVNPDYQCGDIVILDDHINLMWGNPLHGPNEESLGPRFPDLVCPYDSELAECASQIAMEAGGRVHSGTYLAMAGPNYETRAEYRMARQFGADVVGMSTVPEVLVGVHQGVRVLALSVVSNVASLDRAPTDEAVSGQQVLNTVAQSSATIEKIVRGVADRFRPFLQADE